MVRPKGKKSARQLATHAFVRAAQRYDVYLDEDEQTRIVEEIQSGECEFIERQSKTRTLWRVTVSGRELGVVYDKPRKSLVTVIPSDDPRMARPVEDERGEGHGRA